MCGKNMIFRDEKRPQRFLWSIKSFTSVKYEKLNYVLYMRNITWKQKHN